MSLSVTKSHFIGLSNKVDSEVENSMLAQAQKYGQSRQNSPSASRNCHSFMESRVQVMMHIEVISLLSTESRPTSVPVELAHAQLKQFNYRYMWDITVLINATY